MNQPTEDRIKKLEEEQMQLKEEVRQLREQITEPIKIDRLEIDRGGTQELLRETSKRLEQIIQGQANSSGRFDDLEVRMRQELETVSHTWVDALQDNVNDIRADISNVKATLSDHGEMLREVLRRLPDKP